MSMVAVDMPGFAAFQFPPPAKLLLRRVFCGYANTRCIRETSQQQASPPYQPSTALRHAWVALLGTRMEFAGICIARAALDALDQSSAVFVRLHRAVAFGGRLLACAGLWLG